MFFKKQINMIFYFEGEPFKPEALNLLAQEPDVLNLPKVRKSY